VLGETTGERAPARGAVIAFVGSEATGKSTLLAAVEGWLGAEAPVRRVHAGKPPSTALTFVPHVLLPAMRRAFPRQRLTSVEARRTERPDERVSLLFALRAVMLAYERRALLRRAFEASRGGAIVLSDRYPSARSGAPDGPQLGGTQAAGRPGPLGRLASLEARLYRQIPAPALVVRLTAPVDVTLSRNAARGKVEPEEYVRRRHAMSSKLEFDGAPVLAVDTDRPFDLVLAEVKDAVRGAL
jgi:thymidylate kinase